jgi:hypothetical protein
MQIEKGYEYKNINTNKFVRVAKVREADGVVDLVNANGTKPKEFRNRFCSISRFPTEYVFVSKGW